MSFRDEPRRRVVEYAQKRRLTLDRELGFGHQGVVWMAWGPAKQGTAPKQSAIKAHQRETEYVRERDVYLRLLECDVARIRGCEVPQFIDCDDDRCVIEMTMVSPPFLLDFAGAYLDWTPDFSDEALADWRADKLEQFGARWHEVELILGALQSYGIYMIDVHPGNLAFGD